MSKTYKKRILFIGIPDMALVCLDACLEEGINIVGVMGPKPTHNMYGYFKSFVKQRKLNFIEYSDLNSTELHKTLKDLKIDLGLVCSFNYKIPIEMLQIPKDGFVNLHPSLLPLYKGGNPYSHVIINGEKVTGVTIHYMSEEFDNGDIILQKECPISDNETMGTLFNRTNEICTELMIATLQEYEERELPRISQEKGEFIKAPNIKDSDTIINYSKSAIEIERHIRALNPFILATTFFRNIPIKISKAETTDKDIMDNVPTGTIAKITKDNVWIKTSKGCISYTIMQYGSYFIGDAKDFIKIVKPKLGERFY